MNNRRRRRRSRGILPRIVPAYGCNKNKILKTIDMLKNEQRITLSTDSSLLNPPNDNAVPFNENQRIAQIVTAKLNIK